MANILLIEDDKRISDTLSEALRNEGHKIAVAADGEEGSAIFSEMDIDLVITDIIMPNKEGLQVIREFRCNYPELPIIAVSGGGHTKNGSFLDAAGKLGASAILQKPFRLDEIIDLINSLLSKLP